MNVNLKLPDFFVVGAQKSGTTTIHDLLKQNNQISLPEYKETHFFSRDFSKGINWYLKQFIENEYKIRGEVDPSYMFFPNVYKNIKASITNPKFIYGIYDNLKPTKTNARFLFLLSFLVPLFLARFSSELSHSAPVASSPRACWKS